MQWGMIASSYEDGYDKIRSDTDLILLGSTMLLTGHYLILTSIIGVKIKKHSYPSLGHLTPMSNYRDPPWSWSCMTPWTQVCRLDVSGIPLIYWHDRPEIRPNHSSATPPPALFPPPCPPSPAESIRKIHSDNLSIPTFNSWVFLIHTLYFWNCILLVTTHGITLFRILWKSRVWKKNDGYHGYIARHQWLRSNFRMIQVFPFPLSNQAGNPLARTRVEGWA